MTQAFVYHWQELSTNKWYIGSRTRKGCRPNDGYICSSNIVLPLIKSNPADWKRTIIAVGDPKDMLNFEITLLKALDAKNDPMSYNQHNGDGEFTTTGMKMSEETRRKMSKAKKQMSEETRRKMSKAKKQMSEETRRKMREAHKNVLGKDQRRKPIQTPKGIFPSLSKAAEQYNVAVGTMQYWMKSKPHEYYYINKTT